MRNDFAVFILTHGRPDRQYTVAQLKRLGYTGRLYYVVDNEDKTLPEYVERFGDQVVVFDKAAVAKQFDEGDTTNDRRAIFYARNACFEIARRVGVRYFIQLDDDYVGFMYRGNERGDYEPRAVRRVEPIFEALVKFMERTEVASIALAQGGDFIGGVESQLGKTLAPTRKAMNTFVCSVDRPFPFLGRINEDVTTYTRLPSLGYVFLTCPLANIDQKETQSNAGGMTDIYLDGGTYLKSFYSVMFSPSAVRIGMMGRYNRRLHHKVLWDNVAPKILREDVRRP